MTTSKMVAALLGPTLLATAMMVLVGIDTLTQYRRFEAVSGMRLGTQTIDLVRGS